MRRAGGLVLVAGVWLAACGGDSDGRGDYVDALTEAAQSEDATASEDARRCFAESAVDAVGVERLKDAATPDEIREARTTDIATLGVEISEAEGEDFYDRYSRCVDVREILVAAAVGTPDIAPEAGECLETELDEDLIRRFVVTGFAQGTDAALGDEQLMADLQGAFAACTAPPGG